VAINIVGVSGKKFSSLGKIVVCPEKFFDSQNGTLTENFFGDGGGEGAEKNWRHISRNIEGQNIEDKIHCTVSKLDETFFEIFFSHSLLCKSTTTG
jgi:hypothetical protein